MPKPSTHTDNNMGDDLNFATVWPGRESEHINAGTGLRFHTENAMRNASVDGVDAKLRSGRSTVVGDGNIELHSRGFIVD